MKRNEPVFIVFARGEPLGVMTMREAFRWSWSQSTGHVVLDFIPVEEGEKVNGRKSIQE